MIERASEFFYLIAPFVTHLLSVHPELMTEARGYLHMAADLANDDYEWGVSVGTFLEFEILAGRQIKVKRAPRKKLA